MIPVKALSDRAADGDRRNSDRTTALFRPALFECRDFRSFGLVKNISATGLMARIHGPLQVSEDLHVRFDETSNFSGTVVWRDNDKLGVKFDEKLEVEELLRQLSNRGGRRTYRSPRLELEAFGQFLCQSNSQQIQTKDISQRGLKALISPAALQQGDEGAIVLSGLRPRKAVVRWVRNETAGFYFLDPISFDELGEWVLWHEGREQEMP